MQTKLIRLGRFPLSQNFRFEMPESFLCLKERLGLWWIKMTEKIPVIFCPANGNSSSRNGNCVQTERLFSFQTSEGRPFVSENFHLIRAFHLHFNRLNRKFWLNGKRLLYWFELVCHPFPPLFAASCMLSSRILIGCGAILIKVLVLITQKKRSVSKLKP